MINQKILTLTSTASRRESIGKELKHLPTTDITFGWLVLAHMSCSYKLNININININIVANINITASTKRSILRPTTDITLAICRKKSFTR